MWNQRSQVTNINVITRKKSEIFRELPKCETGSGSSKRCQKNCVKRLAHRTFATNLQPTKKQTNVAPAKHDKDVLNSLNSKLVVFLKCAWTNKSFRKLPESQDSHLKVKVDVKSLSRVRLFATPRTIAYNAPPSMDFPGKSTGVGCHFLLQRIFPSPHGLITKHSIQNLCKLKVKQLLKIALKSGVVI